MSCPVFDKVDVLVSFIEVGADRVLENVEALFVPRDTGSLTVGLTQLEERRPVNGCAAIGYEQEGIVVFPGSEIGA